MKSFKDFITEEVKLSESNINKITKTVSKAYNLGKLLDSDFTADGKNPSLMLKFDKVTLVFMKGFDWEGSVDMGLWSRTEYKKEGRAMDAISKSDVIYYDALGDYVTKGNYTGSNILPVDVSEVVRKLFGL